MKIFMFLITNNATTNGGAQSLRQVVLFVFVPFDKNTLGDIIAIRDESGDIVARYVYDAWGNHTVQNEYGGIDYSSTSIGNINPFRYRGYYYDVETGFYYLQTRYYDPTICRFINADDYELVAELASVPGQLNLYAYANNNPVMLTDETGKGLWTTIIVGIFVTVIAGIDGGLSAAISGGDFETGFSVGAVAGLIGYIFGQPLGALGGRLISSALYDICYPLLQNGKMTEADWINLVLDLTMDVAFSSMYMGIDTNSIKFESAFPEKTIVAWIDAGIDIAQTAFIYTPISNAFSLSVGKSSLNGIFSAINVNIKNMYVVGYR